MCEAVWDESLSYVQLCLFLKGTRGGDRKDALSYSHEL